MKNLTISLTQEIRDLDDILFEAKELLIDYPNDPGIELTISSYSERREMLLSELEIAFKNENFHIFDAAIQIENYPSIDSISNILNSIRNGLDAIADALLLKTPLSPSMAMLFNGSFGIRMISKSDDSLVLGDISIGYAKFFDIIKNIDSPNHKTLNEFKGNRKALRKFGKFFKAISNESSPILFRWGPKVGSDTSHMITPKDAALAYTKILMADTAEITTGSASGVIKEINLLTRTFIILLDMPIGKMKQMTLKFQVSEQDAITSKLDKHCTLQFSHERKYNYDEEKIEEERILVSLV